MKCAVNNLTLSAAQDEIFALLGMYCTCGSCSVCTCVCSCVLYGMYYVRALIVRTNLLYTMNRSGVCMHRLMLVVYVLYVSVLHMFRQYPYTIYTYICK